MGLLFVTALHCVSIGFVGHALLKKSDPRSALGWAAALIFLPVAGLAAYLVFGISRAHSRAEKLMRHIAKIENQYPKISAASKVEGQENQKLVRLGDELINMPLCEGNEIIPLRNGDEAYPAMIAAIENAKSHVFLGTYIFNYGQAAKKFIEAITAAHNRGVDCRVLVDGIGSLYSWEKPWKILRERGVKTTLFRPLRLFPPNLGINLRSHRKTLICDNIGFTGGMNIADGNLLSIHRKGLAHIQDMQFQVKGPVVAQLRQAFLFNWSFCEGEITILPPLEAKPSGSCKCRAVMDGPGKDGNALYDLICGAINLSRKSVYIMTPYFLPPCELYGALRSAALRGVDVNIILPGKNNLAYMSWAAEKILPELLRAGAKAWRQAPPFAHTKLMAIDGFYSLIGSANMDARSLKLNFELNMEVYDEAFHDRLVDFMESTLQKGRQESLEELDSLSLPIRLRDAASWIFSPYF